MNSRRLLACASIVLALCTACAESRSYELVCGNGVDDDDDQKADCLDPDCHAHDSCRQHLGVLEPTPDAGQSGPSSEPPRPSPPPPDAGSPPIMPVDAGTVATPPTPDAAPPPACPTCLPSEMCENGACVPVAVMESGHYALKIVSAGAPDMNAASACYDDSCARMVLSPPYGFCICQPDTYVRAVRIRDTERTDLGMTTIQVDDNTAVFNDPPLDLPLEPGDVLSLEVWDGDDSNTDTQLYECKPDLTTIAAGPISCSAAGGILNLQILTVRAELLAPAPP